MEREPEYSKDRLNQQIHRLTLENSDLREIMYCKDKAILDLKLVAERAEKVAMFLGICIGTAACVGLSLVLLVIVGVQP